MLILVTGATGNVGGELVRVLLDLGHQVRGFTRATGASSVLPPQAEPIAGDLNRPNSLTAALAGLRGLFLLPGYQDMPGVLAAARAAGVERVVLLSGGSAGSGDMTNAISAYMIRSESAVRAGGLAWTILRPSAFMSNALRWRSQLASGDVVRVPFATVRTAVVDPFDVAAVAAEALVGAGHEGLIYQPTGPDSLLPADQVGVLARMLGRDVRFEAQPDQEAREEMTKTTPVEYVDAFFDFYVAGTLDESQVRTTVHDVTGQAPRTFEQWAAAHAGAF